jgi:hypothetical protein
VETVSIVKITTKQWLPAFLDINLTDVDSYTFSWQLCFDRENRILMLNCDVNNIIPHLAAVYSMA